MGRGIIKSLEKGDPLKNKCTKSGLGIYYIKTSIYIKFVLNCKKLHLFRMDGLKMNFKKSSLINNGPLASLAIEYNLFAMLEVNSQIHNLPLVRCKRQIKTNVSFSSLSIVCEGPIHDLGEYICLNIIEHKDFW